MQFTNHYTRLKPSLGVSRAGAQFNVLDMIYADLLKLQPVPGTKSDEYLCRSRWVYTMHVHYE